MAGRRDLFKEIKGQSFADWKKGNRIPKASESVDLLYKQNHSSYPLRLLGYGADKDAWITEESRASHMHIIGTTGMGKSYFLLKLMVDDIRRGNGFCFLDPSFQGNTMKMVLSYCQRVGFEKVLIVDPHYRYAYNRITSLNPFHKYKSDSVTHIYDTIRVLFDMKNQAQFSFIDQYMPALLGVLWNAGLTLYESIYFSDYGNPFYRQRVLEILERSEARSTARKQDGGLDEEFDADGITLRGAFASPTRYTDFGSTIRRLNLIYKHDTLKLMFGATERIDFTDLIKKGWVILVNLHQGGDMTPLHTKLLGTSVINEVMFAVEHLNRNKWKGRYYLYVDEAGEYANDKLINLLQYKRQSGLAVILAHQLNSQFSSPEIKKAIQGLTKMKVAFYQPDSADRLETVRMLYGGELEDRQVSYSLKHLKKQEAVIMTDNREPMIVRIPDVKGDKHPSEKFIQKLYAQDFYADPEKVRADQKQRFNRTVYYQSEKTSAQTEQLINEDRRKNTPSPKQASKANSGATGKGRIRQQEDAFSIWARDTEQFKQRKKATGQDGEGQTNKDVGAQESE